MQAHNTQPRILEINVISGEELQIRGRPIKKNAIVYVRTDPCNVVSTKAKKELDGSYPLWNHMFDLNLPLHVRNISVEVFSGNAPAGTASIPVSDFLGDYTPARYLHLLSYRLRDRRGEKNGIINLSIRVKG